MIRRSHLVMSVLHADKIVDKECSDPVQMEVDQSKKRAVTVGDSEDMSEP